MRFLRTATFGLLVGVAALVAGSASAVPIGSINFQMLDADGNTIWNGEYAGHQTADPNVYTVYDGMATAPGVLELKWDSVSIDIDPGVSGNWAITNNTAATQIFTLIVDAPVLPVAPSSLMFGSTTISIADANFDGTATLATVLVSPMYNGRIDLAAVTPATDLFPAVFSLSPPPGGTTGATASFGVFPGTVPGPAVAGFIGIQHVFSLSPGDRATFNSTFHLVVPEPGTLALVGLGIGLVVLAARRRA